MWLSTKFCWGIYVALTLLLRDINVAPQLWSIAECRSTTIPCCQVGVAVHHYLLIGGGAREGSVSWDGGWVGCCLTSNEPNHGWCSLHTIILTPEGDVACFTHVRDSWVDLGEIDSACTGKTALPYRQSISSAHSWADRWDMQEECSVCWLPVVFGTM